MSSILMTGGTGCLGSAMVARLLDAKHETWIASRSPQPRGLSVPYTWATVDYHSGTGLAAAGDGVDRVPEAYHRSKLAVERLIENSGLPCTAMTRESR